MTLIVEYLSLKSGQGVAHDAHGQAIYIPHSIPGERWQVDINSNSFKLVEPSSDRVKPPCSYFGECGGCDFQHMTYARQLAEKQNWVTFALQKAGVEGVTIENILPGKEPFNYRNRAQFQVTDGVSYFKKRGSNETVKIEECLLLEEPLNQFIQKAPLSTEGRCEIRVSENGRVEAWWGKQPWELPFRQVNSAQNKNLVEIFQRKMAEIKAKRVLELFSGDGNLTRCYSSFVEEAWCVEGNSAANQRSKELTKNKNITFLTTSVNKELPEKLPHVFRNQFDTLVLDPPRTAVGSLLFYFLYPRLENIFYVSCSLIDFAKDVQLLQQRGFQLKWLQPIDMFPQTRHLELLGHLTRVS